MAFPYKQVLIVGATSGIGRAMGDRLIGAGSKVIAVGRREDRLTDFVNKHGEDKASALTFDVAKKDEIPQFAADVVERYPDIDCVFLNAGFQQPFDMTDPAKFDLDLFHKEINTNFSSSVSLAHAFLAFLRNKQGPTSLIFTTSNLSIVPVPQVPAYCASKAALNAFVLCLREQLRDTTVKVIELSPPAVQTELHDYMDGNGRKMGMPLDAFVDEAYKGLVGGSDQIIVGSMGPSFDEIVDKRRAAFTHLASLLRQK